ncbi:unnamed protein product [Phytophthora lilii]|uniref:Unnamed protein product n=1 Tax=Phytophthora lilii TaxID=2077276 RepID=A0A9W7D3R5_9STRA|nr:unnamed protein product [Phytophthora lilii]
MCQRRYIDDILKRFGMDECKAVVNPVDMSSRLVPSDAATKVNAPFREAVGALMHRRSERSGQRGRLGDHASGKSERVVSVPHHGVGVESRFPDVGARDGSAAT